MTLAPRSRAMRIVGIVDDVRNEGADGDPTPEVFIDYRVVLRLQERLGEALAAGRGDEDRREVERGSEERLAADLLVDDHGQEEPQGHRQRHPEADHFLAGNVRKRFGDADDFTFDAFFVYPEELKSVARIQVFRDFLVANAQRWKF